MHPVAVELQVKVTQDNSIDIGGMNNLDGCDNSVNDLIACKRQGPSPLRLYVAFTNASPQSITEARAILKDVNFCFSSNNEICFCPVAGPRLLFLKKGCTSPY